jgi:hypothetical protein
MDELVFANLGWPKVMRYQERVGRGKLSGFSGGHVPEDESLGRVWNPFNGCIGNA